MTGPADAFISYAQNGEDIVLRRALLEAGINKGTYVEVGANDPQHLSATKGFYDHGWSGVCVEPHPGFAAAFRRARPRDQVVQAAIVDTGQDEVVLHAIDGTGLSTLLDDIGERHDSHGYDVVDLAVPAMRLDDVFEKHVTGDVHFMLVDTEGAEQQVLASLDLGRWRPWVVVVEATDPLTTKPTHESWEHLLTAADYVFCLFDGLSRFYVSAERQAQLGAALSYPSCALDQIGGAVVTFEVKELRDSVARAAADQDALRSELIHWRGQVLDRWTAVANAHGHAEVLRLRRELTDMQRTVSWRVTRPLRSVRTVQRSRGERA